MSLQLLQESSSFRDPCGVVYHNGDTLIRKINGSYREQFEHFISSGLYDALLSKQLIIEHTEPGDVDLFPDAYKVIRPTMLPLISYPYEWCFGQLKAAAIATLRIHRTALEYGMSLKDASAYNIQFDRGKPLLIDTLSFDFYQEGKPWVAYGQFCRHFLAPLFLMAYVDIRLSQLLRAYIDGIPLDLASSLLKGKGGMAVRQHIHWHSRAIDKHGSSGANASMTKMPSISRFQLVAMTESLMRIVEKLSLKNVETEWGDYYSRTNYTADATANKQSIVSDMLSRIEPSTVWDLGANDGTYSRLALAHNSFVAAFDIDPIAVERNYSAVLKSGENMLPLLLDLANPSPAIGFANKERLDLPSRQKPDCILMLAIIHHMAISNNLPLDMIARWVSGLCRHLIIEFVPKSDSQVQILLSTREDIFTGYTQSGFEEAFSRYFSIERVCTIEESDRIVYLMKSVESQ